MAILQKENALYKNNGANLEPVEVELVNADGDKDVEDTFVKLVPLTRTQLKEFYSNVEEVETENGKTVVSTRDGDAELIGKHLIEPSFNKKELLFLKPKITRNLVLTILKASEQDISGLIKISSLKESLNKEDEKLLED